MRVWSPLFCKIYSRHMVLKRRSYKNHNSLTEWYQWYFLARSLIIKFVTKYKTLIFFSFHCIWPCTHILWSQNTFYIQSVDFLYQTKVLSRVSFAEVLCICSSVFDFRMLYVKKSPQFLFVLYILLFSIFWLFGVNVAARGIYWT